MAWEARPKSRGSYLYAGRRSGKKVRKYYLGSADNPAAQLFGRLARLRKAEKKSSLEARKLELSQDDEIYAQLRHVDARINFIVREGLHVAGFRRPHGGTWRRLKIRPRKTRAEMPPLDSTTTLPSREDFDALVQRAQTRDPEALAELRAVLQAHPEIWESVANLTAHLESTLITRLAGDSVFVLESLRERVVAMRAELTDPAGPPYEHLIIDRIVANWLDLQFCEFAAAQPRPNRRERVYWESRREMAHRRHLDAVKLLATVRKLKGG